MFGSLFFCSFFFSLCGIPLPTSIVSIINAVGMGFIWCIHWQFLGGCQWWSEILPSIVWLHHIVTLGCSSLGPPPPRTSLIQDHCQDWADELVFVNFFVQKVLKYAEQQGAWWVWLMLNGSVLLQHTVHVNRTVHYHLSPTFISHGDLQLNPTDLKTFHASKVHSAHCI